MFYNCISLTSLDLSNFQTSKVNAMENMFYGCSKLEYINMKNFDEGVLNSYNDMFVNVPINVVICINPNNNKILSQFQGQDNYINDCSLMEPFQGCDINSVNKYEYNNKCYSSCPYGYLDYDNTKCKCELEICLTCSAESLKKYQCTKCNYGHYTIKNDPLNIGDNLNCYKNPKGYYLDKITYLYNKCYYTCETCDINGNIINHNCLTCKDEYIVKINKNDHLNCYQKCDNYYYFDDDNNYQCTSDLSCPSKYPILNEETKECKVEDINYIENIIKDLLNFEKNETKKGKEEEINNYNIILKKVESFFISGNYDLTNIDQGKDQIIEAEKVLITLTNIENQKNSIDSNITSILLGDCETSLRNNYNLTNNETIYMKVIEITQDGMKARKFEYDVYSKLSEDKLEKLNLSICGDKKIFIYIPLEINDNNIDKLNTTSGYFNDICYPTTTDDGTDITLNDRKHEYKEGDNIICQEDCVFSEYDTIIKKAKCDCEIKESSLSFADMKIDKNKLFANLKDIKNIVNINILVCYKKLLNLKNIYRNIGSLIIICIIGFHLIAILIFYISQINRINQIIKNIIFGIINKKSIKQDKNKKNVQIKNQNSNISNNKVKKSNQIRTFIPLKKVKNNNNNYNYSLFNKNKSKFNNKNIIINNNNYFINNKVRIKKNFLSENKINSHESLFKLRSSKGNENMKYKNIMNYNNEELNELSYNMALIHDKRTYCQYYCSLLKTKHNLIFSFCNSEDYNAKIIKIDLFFIEFTISYVINALFFNDETMHKIYENKGTFDLETQIPITIYSSLISMVLETPLTFLALSNDNIINFKQRKIIKNARITGKKLNSCLKVKFGLYFFIGFLLLLIFWYYIALFGIIYKNTQYHLLKDTLISLGLSFLCPFGVYLLPGICRIPSLSNPKKKCKCCYTFSKIFQLL